MSKVQTKTQTIIFFFVLKACNFYIESNLYINDCYKNNHLKLYSVLAQSESFIKTLHFLISISKYTQL